MKKLNRKKPYSKLKGFQNTLDLFAVRYLKEEQK